MIINTKKKDIRNLAICKKCTGVLFSTQTAF